MSNQQWVTEVTDGASLRDIGERIGVHHVTVSRRITEGRAETCVAIARAYGADPVQGLVAWGAITAEEASSGDVDLALRAATDLQIAEEMVRRIKEGQATSAVHEPLDGLTQSDFDQAAPLVGDVDDTDDHAWDV